MPDEIAIRVDHIFKDFVLPHEKVNSIKSLFTSTAKKAGNRSKETQHALKDISFEINKGEFFGIVGRNGSGKSTLLKIIAGIYRPTRGTTAVHGKLVPFIELGVGFNPELSGRENIYLNGAILGFSRKQIDANYHDIVAFAELEDFMDQKLKNYSSGMQVRLAFACATRAEADILLVDEVLAVGDADFQRKCFNYFRKLKRNKKTVVFVTHDMNAVREYCDRAVLIDSNTVKNIGQPQDIARDYSKLFLGDDDAEQESEEGENRWGNGYAKINGVQLQQVKDKIVINYGVDITKDLDKLVYGLHIFSADGSELVATNNRLIQAPDIKALAAGDEVKLGWEVLNVFNDGQYTITLTLVGNDGTEFDWYNEAASFAVKRAERSTTSIIPPMQTETSVIRRASKKSQAS